ncbi:MAG: aldehyde dehydrogenase family protein [Gemmatimonadales bacterium]
MQAQAAVRVSPSGAGAPNIVDLPRVTGAQQIDEIVARLREGAGEFVKLSLDERIALARSMQEGYLRVAERSVAAACEARGLPLDMAGEQWACGPNIVVRALRLTIEALESLKRTGNTPIGKVGRTADERLAVRVFPANAIDGILFSGVTVDVHLADGIAEEDMHASRARFYKQPDHEGRVALVLGAGNIDAIVSFDVITKMFNEGKVCVVKMNPVNAFLGPYLEEAFAEAIDRSFLAVVYGGADEGSYLVHHREVDEVHLTGSDKTYEAIVWGPPGPERDERMARGEPLVTKPVTAELGNVSPVIVAPGPYSRKELLYQAEDVAGALALASSFCCCAAKVVITPEGWPQREEFVEAIDNVLKHMPGRKAYYPGAVDRFHEYTAGRADLRLSGAEKGEVLPWAFAPGLDADDASDTAFTRESFCPVLFETAVGGTDVDEFLEKAVDFANERLWGTLTATLVVHPKLQKDPALGAAVERAIGRLRYGTVAVNNYSAMSFAFATPPWGGYPGAKPDDIQSGAGWVHNIAMLEGIEKAVMRHPLTAFPKPVYFPSHRTVTKLARKLTALEEKASWAKVPGTVATAMRC